MANATDAKINKIFILTDEDAINDSDNTFLDDYINKVYSDKTFIQCEDGVNYLTNDSDDALMVMEYQEIQEESKE